MTHAVCYNCGERKFGCLVTCKSCGASPGGNDDALVLSLALSDHYLSPEQLEEVANAIRVGQEIQLPDDFRTAILESLGRSPG